MAEGGGWRSKSQGRGGWHNEGRSYGNPSRGRGRRGGRGGRGGRRERGETEFWNEDVRSTEDDGRRGRGGQYSRGGGRRGGPPPGLRGRDIGMYYAAMSKERKQQEDIQGRQVVHMDTEKERRITNLISNIRANDNIQPQPSTSYRDPFSDDVTDRSLSRERQSKRDEHTADCWDIESVGESGSDDDVEGVIENQHDDVTERGEADITAEETQIEISETDIPHICHYEPLESEFMLEFRQHTEANRAQHQRFPGSSKACSLRRNPDLDTRLQLELAQKSNNPSHQNLLKFRQKLPSYSMKNEIVEVIQGNQAVVLSGETGCGKTTQVAQFLLDSYIEEGHGSRCHIICTQPRRISAISVAERVADERGERCGEGGSVGYQIRLEARIPREQGSILYCTTGILLKRLVSDPWLGCASHVIIDEIHERDIQSDFLMIVLRDLLTQRSDLKLILMSATLNAAMFAKYFDNCPMLNIPGYTFPVKEYLLEDVIEMTRYRYDDPPLFNPRGMFRGQRGVRSNQIREERENFEVYLRNLKGVYTRKTIDVLDGMDFKEIDCDLVGTLIEHICRNKPDGAILVFMPGWEQISKVHKLLENAHYFKSGSFRLIPLHSMMPTVNQREVFQRPPPGTRKIVIATNIAETSITIDDVVYVVDCGKIKMKNYDAENNITTLQPEWVSRANAKQRRGRSGRVQPGECYHLYTGFHEQGFADYQKPEMLRTRLEELCLQIKLLKLGKILPFVSKAMEPPRIESLDAAVKTLVVLNALDANEELTPLGYHLAKMPVDPQTGKMLLFGAMFSCLSPILTIAASLSFKDAFYIPLGKEREADRRRMELSAGSMSDHIMLVNAYKGWEKAKKRGQVSHYCWQNFMSNNTLQMLKNMRQQFVDLLNEVGFLTSKDGEAGTANKHSGNESIVKAVVCAGLYPNVAKLPGDLNRIRNQGKRPLKLCTASERKVELHPKSVNNVERNFPSSWFVYHLKMKTAKIYLYDTSVVSPYPLLFFGGNVSIGKMDGEDCVAVDNWIKFRASPNIAQLVKELRVEFDRVLESKITNPGVTAWDTRTPEGAVMHAIIDLITTAPSAVTFPQQHSSRNQSHSTHSNRGKMERGKRNNPNLINLS